MSKSSMHRLWSWDNCFNALALAKGHPDLAWDQLMVLVDHQADNGAFFDCIDDATVVWNFTKPPIHGWALERMLERSPGLADRLPELFEPLSRATRFWFEARDSTGDGLPEYHHGNDSGWDNATWFDAGVPVKAPDLLSLLALQTGTLARVARRLGRMTDAARLAEQARVLTLRLVDRFWNGERFQPVYPYAATPAQDTGDCLLGRIPLLLGPALPTGVREQLIADLAEPGRFLSPHGLATESMRSPKYEADGYWRGPIWAPTTYLLVDALRRAGEAGLWRSIAQGFVSCCDRHGFAENYDAQTGQGLRDSAYTWSASVLLLLLDELGGSGRSALELQGGRTG